MQQSTRVKVHYQKRCKAMVAIKSALILLMMFCVCRETGAVSVALHYSYTIQANTCNVYTKMNDGGSYDVSAVNAIVNRMVEWTPDEFSFSDLKDDAARTGNNTKKIGVGFSCNGDVYMPALTISSSSPYKSYSGGVLYISDNPKGAVGFAVRSSDSVVDLALQQASQDSLTALYLNETKPDVNLEVWPVIKGDMSGFKGGGLRFNEVTASLTVTVVYN